MFFALYVLGTEQAALRSLSRPSADIGQRAVPLHPQCMEDKTIPDAQVVIEDGSEGVLDEDVVGAAPRFTPGNTVAVRTRGSCTMLVAVISGKMREHRCTSLRQSWTRS